MSSDFQRDMCQSCLFQKQWMFLDHVLRDRETRPGEKLVWYALRNYAQQIGSPRIPYEENTLRYIDTNTNLGQERYINESLGKLRDIGILARGKSLITLMHKPTLYTLNFDNEKKGLFCMNCEHEIMKVVCYREYYCTFCKRTHRNTDKILLP